MKMFRYVGKWLDGLNAERERISREYEALYRDCFEGTAEAVQIKLESWDWVHRTTRY